LKLIKIDEPVKIIMTPLFVIPAKAGIHYFRYLQVPGFPLSRELQLFTKPSKLNNVTENTIKYCVQHTPK